MRAHTLIAVLVGAGVAAYLLGWPVAIDLVAWRPSLNSGLTGPFARSQPFIGLQQPIPALGEGGAELVARTGGRPLGLPFHAHGHLVVADAFRGCSP
jgi:hypothetical protein